MSVVSAIFGERRPVIGRSFKRREGRTTPSFRITLSMFMSYAIFIDRRGQPPRPWIVRQPTQSSHPRTSNKDKYNDDDGDVPCPRQTHTIGTFVTHECARTCITTAITCHNAISYRCRPRSSRFHTYTYPTYLSVGRYCYLQLCAHYLFSRST